MRLNCIAASAAFLFITAGCGDDEDTATADLNTFVTFNAGLTEAVALKTQRKAPVIAAFKQLTADAICLNEVWTDADAKEVMDAMKATHPYTFREKTVDTSKLTIPCKDGALVVYLDQCFKTKCKPKGIGASACTAKSGPCKPEYDKLTDDCKYCLAANVVQPMACLGGARLYTDEGRNGLLLLSRKPLTEKKYVAMDTMLVKRGVLTAKVGQTKLLCTHLPADLSVVPYPKGRPFKSWGEEQAAAITTLLKTPQASGCNVLIGDTNSGPKSGTIDAEWGDNYKILTSAGFSEPWTDPKCTWCKENPVTGGKANTWIDHVMFKGCSYSKYTYKRILDQEISVTSGGASLKTRLSDHYGVEVKAE